MTASTVALLVPVSASTIGVLWLDEPVTFGLIGGLFIILAGVGLLLDLPSPSPAPGKTAPEKINGTHGNMSARNLDETQGHRK